MVTLARRIAVLLLVALAAGACHRNLGLQTGDMPPKRDANRLTRAEVVATHTNDVYDAIRILRPNWLRKRGAMSVTQQSDIWVYLDNVQIGGLGALRSIPVTSVTTLQFLDASTATQRWGTNHVHGAILITTM